MKIRYVYGTTIEDRRRAIKNLQFALEDQYMWYMCTKYRPNKTAIAKGKFSAWITRENFNLACKAIINAMDPVYFYQFEKDGLELDPEKIKAFSEWDKG